MVEVLGLPQKENQVPNVRFSLKTEGGELVFRAR